MLVVDKLNKSFGGIQAVHNCSFTVEQGSITALIGPNGAGKTTAFNLISGILKCDSGTVTFDGQSIQNLPPHQITRRGLSRTFQISRNLPDMTVLENMIVQSPVRGFSGLFKSSHSREEVERAMELLDFVGLTHLVNEETRNLSYGQRKLLDFASQLMTDPKMIMLDEPAGGVNPALLEDIVERIHILNERGITFLIVEHNMDLVMGISHQVVVMSYGQVLATGTPEIIQSDPTVLKAYLGETVL